MHGSGFVLAKFAQGAAQDGAADALTLVLWEDIKRDQLRMGKVADLEAGQDAILQTGARQETAAQFEESLDRAAAVAGWRLVTGPLDADKFFKFGLRQSRFVDRLEGDFRFGVLHHLGLQPSAP